MIEEEKELFEWFKNKLIEEYGYDEKDIYIEPNIEHFGRYSNRYIPDILVKQNEKPYLVVELKLHYSNKSFFKEFNNLKKIASSINAPYIAIVTKEIIEAYKLDNDEAIAIPHLPTKDNRYIKKTQIEIDSKKLEFIFEEIKDILWSGGKRDSYTIINEFNKVLLVKIYDEIEESSLKHKEFYEKSEFSIYDNKQTEKRLSLLFDLANEKYNLFPKIEKLDINLWELEKIVNLLGKISIYQFKSIEDVYFNVFLQDTKIGEVVLSKEYIDLLHKMIYHRNSNILVANSGFGNLSLKFDSVSLIENNRIKYRTNRILQIIKGLKHENHLDDFLRQDSLEVTKFQKIVVIPPFGIKSKEYSDYKLSRGKSTHDISVLYIEKALKNLVDNGLLYIVLPEGFLSNSSLEYVRSFVLDNYELLSITSLPNDSFFNTSIKTSIVVLRKRKIENYNVLMYELDESNHSSFIQLFKDRMTNNRDHEFTISVNNLKDRWDYRYYFNDFMEFENEIKDNYQLLGKLMSTIRGSNLKGDKTGTVDLIVGGSIQDGKLNKKKLLKTTEEKSNENKRGKVLENDLVLSVVGEYPKCAIVTNEFKGANTNSGIVILRAKSNVNKDKVEYICKFLNSTVGQLQLNRGITLSGGVPVITQKEIEKIQIPYKGWFYGLEDEEKKKFLIKKEETINLTDTYDFHFMSDEKVNQVLSIEGIRGNVFGLDVVRGFISLENLSKFETNQQNFQREIDKRHKSEITQFIKDGKYTFFPEIIVAIKNSDELKDENILTLPEKIGCIQMQFNENSESKYNIFNEIEVLDGRHRIESIRDFYSENSDKARTTVSIAFILLDSSDTDNLVDRSIFYNLNAKSKPFISCDYLNLLKEDDEDKLKELKVTNIDLYKFLVTNYKKFYDEDLELTIACSCYNLVVPLLSKYGNNLLEGKRKNILKLLNFMHEKTSDFSTELKTRFYILALDVFEEKHPPFIQQAYDYLSKEVDGFREWLEISNLMDNIHKVGELKSFYKTYQEIYIPKSRKIYLSMPYHKETEWTYYLVKDVINELSINLQIKIELIRTDEKTYGVHRGISETMYKEIESCDLMIADLTGDNSNVFNEVGFKMGVDRVQGLKDTQIIFIVNTKCYYKERLENESFIDGEYEVSGKVLKNKSKDVPFNLRGIKHIDFHTSQYLKAELYKELEQYFNYYKITKVSK